MHARTQATLRELRGVEWFGSVGHASGDEILVVETWEEALEWNTEGGWPDVQLEAANQLAEALLRASPAEFQKWNVVVEGIKPAVEELVREKTRYVVERQELDERFQGSVTWDILHLAVEAEFSDVVKPGFFARLGYWYRRGNWPCGWEGAMAKGRLVVF